MARQLRLLIFAVAAAPLALSAADAPKPDLPAAQGKLKRGEPMPAEFENARKAIEALTPEQRKRFQENFLRWSNLSPAEKKLLLERGEFRRKKMAEDIDAAIRETGIEFDKPRREHFARRYAQERRKIEEQLRQEMEEKRKPLVQEMVARLKAEFSTSTARP